MSTRRWTRTLLVTTLVLPGCQPGAPVDSDTASETGASTSTSNNPTTTATPTSTTDPLPETGTTGASTSELTTGATNLPTSSGVETTDTGLDTTTDAPGLACPITDEPGISQLALAPALFGEGADPSGSPSCGILNPDRGFHQPTSLRSLDAGTLEDALADGITVLYGQVLIPDYREKPLDDLLLADLAAGFDLVRMHGMKVVPRFHYSNDGDEPDATLDRILEHIEQLTPLLQDNADVILTLQAGFIGAWGEWHSSQNGLDAPGPRKQVLDALLAALPEYRSITVRRPSFKQEAYGGPVTPATSHNGSPLSRVGHINDCFLASEDDYGTYQEPGEKDYAIADTPFVPVGGETCAVNPPRSDCPSALDELALLHWTHLNVGYHPDVLDSWKQDGCYAEVACRLGYRLAVTGLRWAATATPGGTVPISFDLYNDGFAAPVNQRPLRIVLGDADTGAALSLDFDLRNALPGESHTICGDLQLPGGLEPGTYRIGLALDDPAPTLAPDPRQAIRLANDEVEWSAGVNWFDAMVTIE